MQTVVITGAAGKIGTAVRPLLRRPDRKLVLVDVREPRDVRAPVECFHRADIADPDQLPAVWEGASAVIHLAGIPVEASWNELARANVEGTRAVLEATRRSGARAVLLASTIHAVGLASVGEAVRRPNLPPRPDSYYGVSKAAVEALGSLYAERFALSVVTVRICAFGERPHPTDALAAATWLSPADMSRLIEAVLQPRAPGHHLVWGVSAGGAELFGLSDQGIGFVPLDQAPRLTDEIEPATRLGGDAADARHHPGEPW